MMGATWSIPLGIFIFILAIIISIIYYLRYKKVYLISYIASISVYIFAVFYTWDVFDLNKNLVLLLLFISTIIMMFLGRYFSKLNLKIKFNTKNLNKED